MTSTAITSLGNTGRGRLMRIVALALLACLAIAPALHAQTSAPRSTSRIIGWPIYTSDGLKIGEVTNIGTYKGQRLMIGEVGLTLGLGTRHVLIPRNLAIVHKDRIVLTITKDRVSQMLGMDR
jgi:sporulation protein YlmC with PRC-barrel domain